MYNQAGPKKQLTKRRMSCKVVFLSSLASNISWGALPSVRLQTKGEFFTPEAMWQEQLGWWYLVWTLGQHLSEGQMQVSSDECFHGTMSGKLFHGKRKSTVILAPDEAIACKRIHSHWANLCLEGKVVNGGRWMALLKFWVSFVLLKTYL